MVDWPEMADLVNETVRDSALGEPAVYHHKGGPDVPVRVLFERAQVDEPFESTITIGAVEPMAEVVLADLPREPKTGDELTIQGRRRRIRHTQPDGNGNVSLFLDKPIS